MVSLGGREFHFIKLHDIETGWICIQISLTIKIKILQSYSIFNMYRIRYISYFFYIEYLLKYKILMCKVYII